MVWFLPVFGGTTTAMSEYESKIYSFANAIIPKIEHRYKNSIQFDIPLQMTFVSEHEITTSWCKGKKDYKECVRRDSVEAYYVAQTNTMYLRNNLSLTRSFDVSVIIHEIIHYVQNKHGLFWVTNGQYPMCIAWLEYDAASFSNEILDELGIYRQEWEIKFNHKWINKFGAQLTGKPHCSYDSLVDI